MNAGPGHSRKVPSRQAQMGHLTRPVSQFGGPGHDFGEFHTTWSLCHSDPPQSPGGFVSCP